MGRDDMKLFQVGIPLAFRLLPAGLLRDHFIRFRLSGVFIIKRISLVKERQLPFDRLHGLRFASKTMLAGDPHLLDEFLNILIQGIQLPLHGQYDCGQLFTAHAVQFFEGMFFIHLAAPS